VGIPVWILIVGYIEYLRFVSANGIKEKIHPISLPFPVKVFGPIPEFYDIFSIRYSGRWIFARTFPSLVTGFLRKK
jgi:hypothetical protein